MNYFSLSGSCLLSILIPVNMLAGSYMSYCRKNGKSSLYPNCMILLGAGVGTLYLYYLKSDPYILFCLSMGTVVGIVQSTYIHRKTEYIEELDPVEIIDAKIQMVLGVILVILPYFSFFQKYILVNCVMEVKYLCYLIYGIWGMEEIVFNLILIQEKS